MLCVIRVSERGKEKKLTAMLFSRWNVCVWDIEISQAFDFLTLHTGKKTEVLKVMVKDLFKYVLLAYGEIADSRFECQLSKPKGDYSD